MSAASPTWWQKAQLGVQDEEIRCLKTSLDEEQRRFAELQLDTQTQTERLHAHVRQLLLQQEEEQRVSQRLQVQHARTDTHAH